MKLWRYGRPIEYLGQRYRLDGMLGSGGMADVCLAWDEREQREVALKILKSDDLDQETLNRFMKEAAQVAHWQHPNIVRIYESMQIELIDPTQGSVLFYMVTEYARGGDLQKRLVPGKPFPLSASFALFRQLCDAVQYAHERGVIHRDLKPLNILFRRPSNGPEEVVLSDFGLAVQIDASHHTFARGGTLAYMAPEQFQGQAMPASDIFALGVILYLLCTGHLPFRRTLQELPRLAQVPAPTPTRPGLLNADLPPALDEVLLMALHELPAERYRQACDLWGAIELALTASAQTFPFVEEFWQNAGQTWPFNGSELPRRSHQVGRTDQTGSSAPLPASEATPVEDRPVSELGSVREKQKASPDLAPGLSFPSYSILTPPNPPGQFAPASGESSFAGRGQASGAASLNEVGSQTRGESVDKRSEEMREALRTGRRDEPSIITLPTASSSGSTTLPRSSRARAQDSDQTSRRRPVAWNMDQQSSRRRVHDQDALTSRASFDGQADSDPDVSDAHYASPPGGTPSLTRGAVSHRQIPPGAADPRARVASRSDAIRASQSSRRGPSSAAPEAIFGTRAARASSGVRHPNPLRIVPAQAPNARPARAKRRGRWPLVPVLTTLALVVLVIAIFAATGFQGSLLNFFGAPVTRVTLIPRSQTLQQNIDLLAVTGTPDPANREIQTRLLTATAPAQSATANATGSIAARRATGQLTFINETNVNVVVQSTVITDNNGVQISFAGPLEIPANPPTVTVPGFAVALGAIGNIPTLDIDKPCCAPNNEIFVKNTVFTGGQDAQPNSVIEQGDIDGAASPLVAAGKAKALASIQAQMRTNERVATGTVQCQPAINSNQKAGTQAKSVTVQVAVTCSETVYDYAETRQLALQLLQGKVNSDPHLGAAYTLAGQLALSLSGINPGAGQQQTFSFQAGGLWTYHFSQGSLRQFAALIAGKGQAAARALLLRQPGIADVQFHPSGMLPVNTAEIQMIVESTK